MQKIIIPLALLLTSLLFSFKAYSQSNITLKDTIDNLSIQKKQMVESNITEQAYNSDYVLLGKVIQIIDRPGPMSEMFHTDVIIRVDSVLKGKVKYKNIIVKQMSGSITNEKKFSRMTSSKDFNFIVGEEVIIFKIDNKNSPFLNSQYVKDKFKTFSGKKTVNDLSEDSYWVNLSNIYSIQNGVIYYKGIPLEKDDFIMNIHKANVSK